MHHSGRSGPVSPELGRRHLNDVALLTMNSTNIGLQASGKKYAPTYIECTAVELLSGC